MAIKKKVQEGIMRGPPPVVPEGAPLYRVTKAVHFINGRLVPPDEGDDSLVRYAGVPGVNLEPVDEAATEARAAADAARAKRVAEAEKDEAARKRLLGLIK